MKLASRQLIQVIFEDLDFIMSSWPRGMISDAELRRSSCVLRRLLTYSDLHCVWTTIVGKRDFIIPSTAITIVHPNRLSEVEFATSSGAESSPGNTLYAAICFRKIQEGDEPIRISKERDTSFYEYLFEKTLIINGVSASRNDIVQFAANKLGGAHFDMKRQKPSEKALDALEGYFLMERPVVIHELLSYGQQLARSSSANELFSAMRNSTS